MRVIALSNYLWSGPVTGLASIRDSPTTVIRPYVPVRADVNTDAIARIMNVVGRDYRLGCVRSRPSTRLRRTACSSQPTADQRLRTFCRARAG
jgi:hypothetical protein